MGNRQVTPLTSMLFCLVAECPSLPHWLCNHSFKMCHLFIVCLDVLQGCSPSVFSFSTAGLDSSHSFYYLLNALLLFFLKSRTLSGRLLSTELDTRNKGRHVCFIISRCLTLLFKIYVFVTADWSEYIVLIMAFNNVLTHDNI